MDKKVKLILLIINRAGIEVNYTTVSRYSEKFDSIVTTYTLTFWRKGKNKRKNKKTGILEDYYYPVIKEFTRISNLIRYLLKIKDKEVDDT